MNLPHHAFQLDTVLKFFIKSMSFTKPTAILSLYVCDSTLFPSPCTPVRPAAGPSGFCVEHGGGGGRESARASGLPEKKSKECFSVALA